MDKLTRAQKRQLANLLVQAAGDLICPPEEPTTLPADIDREAAAHQFAAWLNRVPNDGLGDLWAALDEAARTEGR